MLVKISKRLILVLIVFLCIFMVSCATQLNLVKTTVSKLPNNAEPFHKKLLVKRIVGEEISDTEKFFVGDTRIDLYNLRKTINASISQTNLFELSDMENCDYLLVPTVFENKTSGAISLTSNLEVLYKLVDIKSNEVIWESRIKSSVKKTMGDSILGAVRFQMAQEGALKENSKKLIEEMARIKLPKE